MPTLTLTLRCDAEPILAAISSLSELAQRSPELVQRFLDGLDASSELVRVELDGLPASRTGECRTVLHPSNRLAEFLSAAGAGEFDGL